MNPSQQIILKKYEGELIMNHASVLKEEIAILKAKLPKENPGHFVHGMTVESAVALLDANCITNAVEHLERMQEAYGGCSSTKERELYKEATELLNAIKAAYNIPEHTWGWSQARGHYDSYKTWEEEYVAKINKEIATKETLLEILLK